MAITADSLVSAVRRKCFWPDADSDNPPLTTAQTLAICDEEMLGTLMPMVIKQHGDYYLTYEDQAITAQQAVYMLPQRLYGPIKDVTAVDETGNEFSIGAVDREQIGHGIWVQRYYGQFSQSGLFFTLFLSGDSLQVRPVPQETRNTLRVSYYRKPSTLTLATTAASVGVVQAVAASDSTHTQVTFTTTKPSAMTTGVVVDAIAIGNAHAAIEDITITATGSTSITFLTSDLKGRAIRVGDYVALQGLSPILQLPDFMQLAAIRWFAASCLQAAKDSNAAGEFALANDALELALETGTPRLEGEPQLVTTPNSPYRTARVGGWGGRFADCERALLCDAQTCTNPAHLMYHLGLEHMEHGRW